MYDHWNLDVLYTGTEDKAFLEDTQKLKEACQALNALPGEMGKTDNLTLIKNYLTVGENLTELAGSLLEYLYLRTSVNVKDEEAASGLGRLTALLSTTAGAEAELRRYIGTLHNLEELIAKDALLTEYAYLLRTNREDAAHLRSGSEETIMARYNLSGGSAWEDLRNSLTSSVKVAYNGRVTTLSDIRNLAYDEDGQVRKAAYEAEIACYDQIKEGVAYALNSIKLQTITETQIRGYEKPLDATLQQSRTKKETLDALLTAMVEYMPHFRRYLKAKAKLLGHENGLPWYDLFAPVGKSDSKFTPEEAHKYLLTIFRDFDEDIANVIDRAFTENWIDFFPAQGKQGGAFCAGIRKLNQSRVLTNFGGYLTDVVTLAHELGHAFHGDCVFSHRPLNNEYSMPVAETASNFNEIVVMDYAMSHAADNGEKLELLEGKLADTTQIICDIYSRYLFEKAVFDSREQNFMFPDRLCELMTQAQKEAYGDGLDPDCLHPYMWVCKSHYYSPSLSYYNWPYAFGGLFAQGLYAKYQAQGKDFLPLYKKLLHATTVSSVEDTATIAGIDLTDPAFWRTGLDYFVGLVDQYEALAEEARK